MIFEHGDKIIFAGDSVTDMGSVCPVGDQFMENLGRSYVRIIDNLLSACYPERIIGILNAGISGNTSRDLLARWDNDILSYSPTWISICIGINDVWRQFDMPAYPQCAVTPEDYYANVERMVISAKEHSKGVFLMTPYMMEPCRNDPMRARMDEYGDICRKIAEKHSAILVDAQKAFDDFFTYRHSASVAWDRIHPNQVGATVIAREFLSHCNFDYTHKA